MLPSRMTITDGQLLLEITDFSATSWSAGFWFNSDLDDPNDRPH